MIFHSDRITDNPFLIQESNGKTGRRSSEVLPRLRVLQRIRRSRRAVFPHQYGFSVTRYRVMLCVEFSCVSGLNNGVSRL